jgi:multidrug efflux pump subunit AcrB
MRNTLILIDQIEQDMAHGLDPRTAAIESTVRRARPVVLTALAAVLAFLPLTLSSFWGQLAVVLIGGVSVGTVLTLLVLPAAYVMFLAPRHDVSTASLAGAAASPAEPRRPVDDAEQASGRT